MEVYVPRILIVEARFYEHFSCMLLEGCIDVLKKKNISWNSVVTPGVLEIPAAVNMAINAVKHGITEPYNGIIVLGVVIKGETLHHEMIGHAVTRSLVDISVRDYSLPIGNGIIVVDNEKQANERASASHLDRGGFAARSVLKMIELKKSLSQ
ncbi:MAG: 6,7-dimethyl-8-ribityllumazine synthase [Candidatus Liberibacter ctenarytainae]|uniref:6,7-dimethyl-8-ribityllumazine synthase n=1 Tax=Candidatus Liberibacter ctenarytainae TaxID=2020335 RepID=A0A937ABN9_9HYPH|nr:6,7-dimethyl-8-ribityllumazine synthase [Candidatus Liberibacter ctenarytainae]